jgi:S-disulfanyl-L-cysteine oxidoreductase SoxD
MCMRDRIVAYCALCTFGYSALAEQGPGLGQEMSTAEVAAIDFAVMPDGEGLPPGTGSASAGAALYQQHCLACHGEEGHDGLHDPLAGGKGTIAGPVPEKTVGSYWPYATTLFDYIRRAMPYQNPGTFSNDELYALTAYVLYLNGIVGESDRIDARSLPLVEMPNRDNFVWANER